VRENKRLLLLLLLLLIVAALRIWVDYREGGPFQAWIVALQRSTSSSYKRDITIQRFKETLEWRGMWIPEGTFLMGIQRKEDAYASAYPESPVTLQGYYLGETNVSQWEWNRVVRATKHLGYEFRNWKQDPEWDSASELASLERPMEGVSWLDAVAWCNAKSELLGLDPLYWTKAKTKSGWAVFKGSKAATVQISLQEAANGYRLPTEAEWERAARGGLGRNRFPWGDTVPEKPSSVPNAFGLIGMVSNPGNWCWDKFAPYTSFAKTNPAGPVVAKGSYDRVLRGRPEKGAKATPVFAREHFGEGDPVGGLRLAASSENPWLRISKGSYEMGDTYVVRDTVSAPLSHKNQREWKEGAPDEFPAHFVHVEEFYLYRSEIPLDEWRRVKDWGQNNGYEFENPGAAQRNDHPVTGVNWYDVVKWCNARSEMDGLSPYYHTSSQLSRNTVYRSGRVDLAQDMVDWKAKGYRLPTEAEWEWAAKMGSDDNRYPCGKDVSHLQAVFVAEREEGKGVKRVPLPHALFGEGPAPVRSYGSWGLYNMTGNVREWCWDAHASYPPYPGAVPETSPDLALRSMRGGSWRSVAWECRSSRRMKASAAEAASDTGFRIVVK